MGFILNIPKKVSNCHQLELVDADQVGQFDNFLAPTSAKRQCL